MHAPYPAANIVQGTGFLTRQKGALCAPAHVSQPIKEGVDTLLGTGGAGFFFVSQYSDQVVPILGLVGLRSLIGLADRLLRHFGKDKKDPMQVRWFVILHAPCRAVCMESFHVVEEVKNTSAA